MSDLPRVAIVAMAGVILLAAALSGRGHQQAQTPPTVPVPAGNSGALIAAGDLDINTAVVPRLAAANQWTGYNQFAGQFRLQPSNTAPPCATPDDAGRVWIDGTDPQNDVLRVCLIRKGVPGWFFSN